MLASTVNVKIPPDLLNLGFDRQEIQHRVTEWLILSLFIEGRISSGKAATLLHLKRADFLESLKQRGIAYINFNAEELHEEFEAVRQLEVEVLK